MVFVVINLGFSFLVQSVAAAGAIDLELASLLSAVTVPLVAYGYAQGALDIDLRRCQEGQGRVLGSDPPRALSTYACWDLRRNLPQRTGAPGEASSRRPQATRQTYCR